MPAPELGTRTERLGRLQLPPARVMPGEVAPEYQPPYPPERTPERQLPPLPESQGGTPPLIPQGPPRRYPWDNPRLGAAGGPTKTIDIEPLPAPTPTGDD